MHKPRGPRLHLAVGRQHPLWASSSRRRQRAGVLLLLLLAAAPACWLCLAWLRRQGGAFTVTDAAHADSSSSSWATVQGRVHDRLLQATIAACMAAQPTWIALQTTADVSSSSSSSSGRRQRVLVSVEAAPLPQLGGACPPLFIPLAPHDRSIGLCTDAALYVQLLGAWLAPDSAATHAHVAACCRFDGGGGAQRAAAADDRSHSDGSTGNFSSSSSSSATSSSSGSGVLFLEPLYEPWLVQLAAARHTPAVLAPNFEQLAAYDGAAHARMDLVLCKVARCAELMAPYLKDLRSAATLMYTGHTSLDVLELAAAPEPTSPNSAAAAAATGGGMRLAAAAAPLAALHVRGKSPLKHTKQLLDCWAAHPEWPRLTVVGPLPNEQISLAQARAFLAAGNIVAPRPGKRAGPGWPEFDPMTRQELNTLLLGHALHVVPSEREGFGHAINEGRGAGALLLVPRHPPMSELVRQGAGVLITPAATFSHADAPVPALARYGNISASVSPQGICAAVARALAMSDEQRRAAGAAARRLFERDRRDFEQRMLAAAAWLRQHTRT